MNRNVRYQVAFIRNGQGRVITDVSQLPDLLSSSLAQFAAALPQTVLVSRT